MMIGVLLFSLIFLYHKEAPIAKEQAAASATPSTQTKKNK
jgi:hypothetical protein